MPAPPVRKRSTHRLHRVASFQRVQYGRREISFLWISTANTTSAVGSRFTSTVTSDAEESSLETPWWDEHFISVVFLPQRDNHSLTATPAELKPRAILQSIWSVLSKLSRSSKTRKWDKLSESRGGYGNTDAKGKEMTKTSVIHSLGPLCLSRSSALTLYSELQKDPPLCRDHMKSWYFPE